MGKKVSFCEAQTFFFLSLAFFSPRERTINQCGLHVSWDKELFAVQETIHHLQCRNQTRVRRLTCIVFAALKQRGAERTTPPLD